MSFIQASVAKNRTIGSNSIAAICLTTETADLKKELLLSRQFSAISTKVRELIPEAFAAKLLWQLLDPNIHLFVFRSHLLESVRFFSATAK